MTTGEIIVVSFVFLALFPLIAGVVLFVLFALADAIITPWKGLIAFIKSLKLRRTKREQE